MAGRNGNSDPVVQPLFFHRTDHSLIAFAGIWTSSGEGANQQERYTILTTALSKLAATVHNRMPAILDESGFASWLDPDNQDRAVLEPLLQPYPDDRPGAYPVSRMVNNVPNDRPECVEPMTEI